MSSNGFLSPDAQKNDPLSEPVSIERQLSRRHACVDVGFAARYGIARVVSEGLIERMIDIIAPYVTVARPAKIAGMNSVRSDVSNQ